jgi:hypothetical protein
MTVGLLSRGGVRVFRDCAMVLAALGALSACRDQGSSVEATRLEATGDTVITPFGEITDAAWLGDARWVVIAPQDRAVSVADFSRKKPARFGGARAAELEQPFHLFRAGDSIYIADWFRRRLTSWSLDGRYGGARPASDALRGALPRGRDDAGRSYFELRPAPGRDGRGNLDSAVIVQASADPVVFDTIGRLAPLDLVEVVSNGQRRLERRLLSGQDRWGVLPDGSYWVARANGNRVDWRDPSGRETRGPALPDRVLPVTQNDRDIFLLRFETGLRPSVSQIPFAAIKPPFEAALSSPEGQVWLVRSRAIGDTLREYHVVDRRGRLVSTSSHPGLGRILALGGGYALVGESFAEGVRLLAFRVIARTATGNE